MPTFRDLWIWQESHKLMIEIHEFAKTLPKEEKFRKRDQMERSFSSVPDNISEGYGSYYYNDKIKCMFTMRKEASETQNYIETLVHVLFLRFWTPGKITVEGVEQKI